jgi:NADH pyrophosphatase NudC (nudix superfamily)
MEHLIFRFKGRIMLKYTQFKFCPRCGKESISLLEENGMICSSCGLKYFHNTAAAVGGIIVSPQGIVLAERAHEPSKGKLDIPGGFTDYNESLETTLYRELLEELGIKVTKYRYIASFPNEYQYSGITYFTADAIFLVAWEESFKLVPNDEIAKIHYIDIHSFDIDELAFASTRKAFKLIVDNEILS